MKKSLIALAALAATTAFAQSTPQLPSGANPNAAWNGVLITGGFDANVGQQTNRGANTTYTGVGYNGTYTSQIDFAGVEDLGGGFKADFFFESDINTASQYNNGVATVNAGTNVQTTTSTANTQSALAAATWGNGQVKVGLNTPVGYIAIGAVNNAGLDSNQMTQPYGTAWGSGYGVNWATVGGGYSASAKVRYDNSVRYLTPEFAGGFMGSLVYRGKSDKGANALFSSTSGLQNQSAVTEVAGFYRNGPLNLVAVYQLDDGNAIRNTLGNLVTAGAKYTTTSLGGNYNMGAAGTLYAGYQTMKNDVAGVVNKTGTQGWNGGSVTGASVDNTAYRIGYKIPVSAQLSLSAAYTSLKASGYLSPSTTNGNTTTVAGVGADYAMSKMTSLYFRYDTTKDNVGNMAPVGTAGTLGAGFTDGTSTFSRTRTAVGLRTTF